jgi:hypothetical protein
MRTDQLFPYLQRRVDDPTKYPHRFQLDHDLEVVLHTESLPPKGDATPVLLEQLEILGLSIVDAHSAALDNLGTFAEGEAFELQTIGQPGAEHHFVLMAAHPLVASMVLLPYLRAEMADLLGTDDLCALVPQQETLVVFPKRDRQFRQNMLTLVREVEADAPKLLTWELFELTDDGPRAVRDEV